MLKMKNDGKTTLDADITSLVTSITVAKGDVFPTLAGEEWFPLTLIKGDKVERMRVTGRFDNILTVIRGSENTEAQAWESGDDCILSLTAGAIVEIQELASGVNELKVLALNFNISEDEIIYSTDKETNLKSIKYIYDKSSFTIYENPFQAIELFDESIDDALISSLTVPLVDIYSRITGINSHPDIIVGQDYKLIYTLDRTDALSTAWLRYRVGGVSFSTGSSGVKTFTALGKTCVVEESRSDNGTSGSILSLSLQKIGETIISITDGWLITTAGEYDLVKAKIGSSSLGESSFSNVTALENYQGALDVGKRYQTGKTIWEITETVTVVSVGDVYAKAIGDVYVDDFVDDVLTDSEILHKCNDYCQNTDNKNRLVFEDKLTFSLTAEDSFVIYVEGGGWYCATNCQLVWFESPTSGYAIRVQGRYTTTSVSYATRINNSNYAPIEGFTIGSHGESRAGSGLRIGYADQRQSIEGATVTSKFKISRVNVLEFDDCVDIWMGAWAFELEHVNTIGGSWRTPSYFSGLDYGENIKLSHCFVADNHSRVVDGESGAVVFSSGEFIIEAGSFDNMRVTIEGDANVKMFGVHFENPSSTAKNKRFLEVIGDHASCVLDNPTIIIRNTDIYSTLFYCKAGTDENRYAWSGGLTLNNPQYQSVEKYRPDLALIKSIADNTTYEGDGYMELVGGGGRVMLTGQAFINSLYYTYNPILIARNLIGRSLDNYDFALDELGALPKFWKVYNTSPYTGLAVVSDDDKWVGTQCLKTTADYNGGETWNSSKITQEVSCAVGSLVLAHLKVKWVTENTNDQEGSITGKVVAKLDFYDADGVFISTEGSFSKGDVVGNSSSTLDNWITVELTARAPMGSRKVVMNLVTYSTSNHADKKIHTYWDTVCLNVL